GAAPLAPAAALARTPFRASRLARARFAVVSLALLALTAGAAVLGRGDQPPTPSEARAGARPTVKPPEKGQAASLDAFGDPLPPDALPRLGPVRLRHASEVLCVAFTPDNKTLLSGSQDGTIRLWEAATGKEIGRWRADPVWVYWTNALAVAPDGKLVASARSDGKIQLWQRASGRLLRTLEGHQQMATALAFAAGGQTLLSGSEDGTVRLWDVDAGRELWRAQAHKGQTWAAVFSPDGKAVACAGDGGVVLLLDAATGKER